MADITVSSAVDTFMQAANQTAMQAALGTALTGFNSLTSQANQALFLAVGSVGNCLSFNGTTRVGSFVIGGTAPYFYVRGATPGGTGANTGVSDYLTSNFRHFSVGADVSTNGAYQFYTQRSDDSNQVLAMQLSGVGALTLASTVTTAAAVAWDFGAANVVSPTSPNRTLTVIVGGSTYYIAAKTTNN